MALHAIGWSAPGKVTVDASNHGYVFLSAQDVSLVNRPMTVCTVCARVHMGFMAEKHITRKFINTHPGNRLMLLLVLDKSFEVGTAGG